MQYLELLAQQRKTITQSPTEIPSQELIEMTARALVAFDLALASVTYCCQQNVTNPNHTVDHFKQACALFSLLQIFASMELANGLPTDQCNYTLTLITEWLKRYHQTYVALQNQAPHKNHAILCNQHNETEIRRYISKIIPRPNQLADLEGFFSRRRTLEEITIPELFASMRQHTPQ